MNEEINIVSVYCDKKLKMTEKFKSVGQACAYAEKHIGMGYYCILERFDNGKRFARIEFKPQESC